MKKSSAPPDFEVEGRENIILRHGKCFVQILTRRQGKLEVPDDTGSELIFVGRGFRKTGLSSFTTILNNKISNPGKYIVHVFDAPVEIKSVISGHEKIAFDTRPAFNEAIAQILLAGDR